MNSLIFGNNQATYDTFTHHILPYFTYDELNVYSQINQHTEEYSSKTYIDNLDEVIESKLFIKNHENIIGCMQYIYHQVMRPKLLQRLHITDDSIHYFATRESESKYLKQYYDQFKNLTNLKYSHYPRNHSRII